MKCYFRRKLSYSHSNNYMNCHWLMHESTTAIFTLKHIQYIGKMYMKEEKRSTDIFKRLHSYFKTPTFWTGKWKGQNNRMNELKCREDAAYCLISDSIRIRQFALSKLHWCRLGGNGASIHFNGSAMPWLQSPSKLCIIRLRALKSIASSTKAFRDSLRSKWIKILASQWPLPSVLYDWYFHAVKPKLISQVSTPLLYLCIFTYIASSPLNEMRGEWSH